MSLSISDLLKQRAELDLKIESAQRQARDTAFADIQTIMTNAGISRTDLLGYFPIKESVTRKPVEPKYRDPISGKSWSGRGKPPLWIAGKNLDDFKI
jgi:DNA-binding protein H-NS